MDAPSLRLLKLLHPKIRKEALEIYNHINKSILGKGVRLRITQTLRTIEEQDALYAKGRTAPGPRVTNAKGGSSYHNYGLSFDIALLLDKDGNGTFEPVVWDINTDFDHDKKADWMEIVTYLESKGWKWGGRWTSFKDYPHFEKVFSYTTKQLKNLVDKGIVIKEVIDGKEYIYPKI